VQAGAPPPVQAGAPAQTWARPTTRRLRDRPASRGLSFSNSSSRGFHSRPYSHARRWSC